MSAQLLYPSCDRPILATYSPECPVRTLSTTQGEHEIGITMSSPIQAHWTAPEPVRCLVLNTPSVRRFELSTDENFILIPIAGGGTAQVPYDPVA